MKNNEFPDEPSARFQPAAESPFPTDTLPPPIAAMVRAVSEIHHVPEVMAALIALTMVSAALGKGLHIASARGRRTMGNLYSLISAASGTGKSLVLRILRAPLDALQADLKEAATSGGNMPPTPTYPTEGSEGSEGLLTLPRPARRLICSEVTGPALAKLLAENQETTLNTTAEAGNLLNEASKSASALGQLLLKAYSGDQVEIDRISRKRPIMLDQPCIAVCWLCQPHRLETFLASDRLLEDGLLARFLVVHSKAKMAPMHKEDKTIPVGVSDGYAGVIRALFEAYGLQANGDLTVDTSDEASAVLRAYYNLNVERWNAEEGCLLCCIARWTEQAWKLTLVLHAATHGANAHRVAVERETAERAVALQEWFAGQQVRIVQGSTRQKEVDRLEKLCRLLSETPSCAMTLRDLQNSHGFRSKEVHRLAELAPSHLDLQKRNNPRGGPSSYVLVLISTPS